jgi:EpsI family protein
MRSVRLWLIVLMMAGTLLVLHVRGDVDHVPPSHALKEMPQVIDNRRSQDIAIDDETLAVLGKGDFLNRVYQEPREFVSAADPGSQAEIGLYIAYFATQRTGQAIHSPQNCLPGAGWTFQDSGVTRFTDPTGKAFTVGDYLITNGTQTEEALYWYQLHGSSIASDYKAKLFTLVDSIRYGRTDEALVRIMTPVEPGEDRASARARAVSFAREVALQLPAYVPN